MAVLNNAGVNGSGSPADAASTLRLRPCLAIVPMNGGVQLRGGDEEIVVLESDQPQVVESILHSLAQGEDRAAILAKVGGQHAELVGEVLQKLAQERLLTTQPADPEDEIASYLSHFTAATAREIRRPVGPVCVVGHSAAAKLIAQAIAAHGISVSGTPNEPDTLTVCVWEHLDPALILQGNATACREGRPCLFVDLSHGCHATLGPFYVPGESSCYACYRERWRQNSAALAEADAAWNNVLQGRSEAVPYGMLPAFRYQAAGLASAEVFAFLSRHRALRTLNRALTIDFEEMRMWSEPVWKIPWCPSCGERP